MQWIYLICFILLSAGLLALFGVKPGDFIDALFRSQRKSATLSDELNVLLGTPAKGFFNQDYELKQILKGTGRADRYEAIKRLSLILFAVGAVLALLIGNTACVWTDTRATLPAAGYPSRTGCIRILSGKTKNM